MRSAVVMNCFRIVSNSNAKRFSKTYKFALQIEKCWGEMIFNKIQFSNKMQTISVQVIFDSNIYIVRYQRTRRQSSSDFFPLFILSNVSFVLSLCRIEHGIFDVVNIRNFVSSRFHKECVDDSVQSEFSVPFAFILCDAKKI